MTDLVPDRISSRYPDKWPKVAAIILNWNGWKDSLECLESIFGVDYPNCDVMLIDNGSSDESILEIRKYVRGESFQESASSEYNSMGRNIDLVELHFPIGDLARAEDFGLSWRGVSGNRMALVKTDRNVGFTGGNNIGIRIALRTMCPDYILLLNNDTVVERNFLKELVLAGEKFSNAAFLSPKIYFYEHEGRRDVIQYAGGKQNLWICSFRHIGFLEVDRGQYELTQRTDFAHGSCMLVNTKSIRDIGLLDEDFFSYREENDWAIRGRLHGWDSFYVSQSKIWHKGGRSGGSNNLLSTYYVTRNDFIFMKKNSSKAQYLTFLSAFIVYKLWLNFLRYLVFHRRIDLFRSYIKGSVEGLRWRKKR